LRVTGSRSLMIWWLRSVCCWTASIATVRRCRSYRSSSRSSATGSPEAIAHPRLPQNVACGFPALRSSAVGSQHCERL
jgi:hypothetical protein